MKRNPLVTVLMAVYNGQKCIRPTIESILNQTFKNFEFIIIDDGCTDSSPDILLTFAQKDSRIKIFRIKNSGTTVAANYGLSKSVGKYIARIDSDDISFQDRLKMETDYLNNHPEVGLVGSGSQIIDTNGKVIGERNINVSNTKRALQKRNIFQQSNTMFRSDLVKPLGGYREKFHNGEDYDLWLRIADVASVTKLDEILGQWRLNGSGYSFSRRHEQLNSDRIIKEFAKQRGKNGKDQYGDYNPVAPGKHRQEITDLNYNLWVSVYLIQSFRKKEARKIIIDNFNNSKRSIKVIALLLSTFFPNFVLRLFFDLRNYFKNNF